MANSRVPEGWFDIGAALASSQLHHSAGSAFASSAGSARPPDQSLPLAVRLRLRGASEEENIERERHRQQEAHHRATILFKFSSVFFSSSTAQRADLTIQHDEVHDRFMSTYSTMARGGRVESPERMSASPDGGLSPAAKSSAAAHHGQDQRRAASPMNPLMDRVEARTWAKQTDAAFEAMVQKLSAPSSSVACGFRQQEEEEEGTDHYRKSLNAPEGTNNGDVTAEGLKASATGHSSRAEYHETPPGNLKAAAGEDFLLWFPDEHTAADEARQDGDDGQSVANDTSSQRARRSQLLHRCFDALRRLFTEEDRASTRVRQRVARLGLSACVAAELSRPISKRLRHPMLLSRVEDTLARCSEAEDVVSRANAALALHTLQAARDAAVAAVSGICSEVVTEGGFINHLSQLEPRKSRDVHGRRSVPLSSRSRARHTTVSPLTSSSDCSDSSTRRSPERSLWREEHSTGNDSRGQAKQTPRRDGGSKQPSIRRTSLSESAVPLDAQQGDDETELELEADSRAAWARWLSLPLGSMSYENSHGPVDLVAADVARASLHYLFAAVEPSHVYKQQAAAASSRRRASAARVDSRNPSVLGEAQRRASVVSAQSLAEVIAVDCVGPSKHGGDGVVQPERRMVRVGRYGGCGGIAWLSRTADSLLSGGGGGGGTKSTLTAGPTSPIVAPEGPTVVAAPPPTTAGSRATDMIPCEPFFGLATLCCVLARIRDEVITPLEAALHGNDLDDIATRSPDEQSNSHYQAKGEQTPLGLFSCIGGDRDAIGGKVRDYDASLEGYLVHLCAELEDAL